MSHKKLRLWSWAFYDFANTIFSAVVLTAYFPLTLTEQGGANWYLGVATTGAMLLAGTVTPLAGALSDETGKTKNYLWKTTLAAVFFTAVIALVRGPWPLISVFIFACLFYHSSLVFYNSLLPVAAEPEEHGFASGLGTGLGYLGVVCTLPVAHEIDTHWGRPAVFLMTAVLFLVCSLPLFIFVPERETAVKKKFSLSLGVEEWKKLIALVKDLPRDLKLLFFLVGNFLIVDALNATIFWFMVFAREVFHPGQKKLILMMMAVNASAFIAGIVLGFVSDRLGGIRSFIISSLLLMMTLALLAVSPDFKMFLAAVLTGGAFGIAGIWTAGRKALLELSPSDKTGSYFGLYGLTTKISVIGNLIFSLLADRFGFRPALWSLVIPASAGTFLLILSSRKK